MLEATEPVEPRLEVLSRWLLQQPAHIFLIAAVNLGLWAACRATVLRTVPKSNVLWVTAVMWLAYAGWEWLVLVKSPEANSRFDLLLIWPVIALATLWAFVRAARGWWAVRRHRQWRRGRVDWKIEDNPVRVVEVLFLERRSSKWLSITRKLARQWPARSGHL